MRKLTDKQNEALKIIKKHGPAVSISEIARILDVSRTAARARVEQLEKWGRISRETTIKDGKIHYLFTVLEV